jgi:uncharacterized protein YndB with AHSA1/START domain
VTDPTTPASHTTIQVYRVYIKATAEKIWQAITDPEWNARYGYGAPSVLELRPGGAHRSTPSEAMRAGAAEMGWTMPDVVVDGEVLEVDPPRLLRQTWRMAMDPTCASEGFSTLTYTIQEEPGGVCKLTVTHDVTGMPTTAAMVQGGPAGEPDGPGAGGWPWILSDLKSLLETGTAFSSESSTQS